MAIHLYQKKDYGGKSLKVTSNISDLSKKSFNNKASSMKMTEVSDKILLFKKKKYKGGVMFRDGQEKIPSLCSGKKGGQMGFGNKVSSVRITPFTVNLYMNIISTDEGTYPGSQSLTAMNSFISDMIAEANRIWDKGLLKFKLSSTATRKNSKLYNMNNEFLKLASKNWDKKKCINVYVVNSISASAGISLPPGIGNAIAVEYKSSSSSSGNTLAHEIGHTLGIHHGSADKSKSNLMCPSGSSCTALTDKQIDKVHRVLAKNIFRKGLRNE